jgi:hypothetical protein
VAGPGLAPPALGGARVPGNLPDQDAFPFDAGPYDRFPPPLGAFRIDSAVVRRRAILVVLVAWVPLLVLSAVEGRALAANAREAFLLDIPAYARYLIALPLLIVAERMALPKLGTIARHLLESGMVPAGEQPRYLALLEQCRRLLSSLVTTIVIFVVAYVLTVWLSERVYPSTISTWAAPITESGRQLSPAGWWRALVSQPLYVALMCLWIWRALVWAFFLNRVSRLDLKLVASHPDHVGGLQFVVWSPRAFALVALAVATAMAGNVGQRVLVDGASVLEFKATVAVVMGTILLLFVGPLLALRTPLRRLRAQAILSYGELAADLGQRFERRWVRKGGDVSDDALEVPDFSAVTDAYSIVANVGAIKLIPIDLRETALLVLVALVPFVPLLLVAIPVADVLKFAANLLL